MRYGGNTSSVEVRTATGRLMAATGMAPIDVFYVHVEGPGRTSGSLAPLPHKRQRHRIAAEYEVSARQVFPEERLEPQRCVEIGGPVERSRGQETIG